jgi:hypothetical protein
MGGYGRRASMRLQCTTYSQSKIFISVKGLIALSHQNVYSYTSTFQLGQKTVIMNFNSFTHTEY